MTQRAGDTVQLPKWTPFQEALRVHIRAGYPILYVVTAEEERALELMQALIEADLPRRRLYLWSVSQGLCEGSGKTVDRQTADPKQILPHLLELNRPGVFVLKDFHFFLDERSPAQALLVRQLRDFVGPLKHSPRTLILLSPVLKIPPELEKDVTVLDLDMPTEEELLAVLEDTVAQVKDNPRVDVSLAPGDGERIVKALCGLTRSEAQCALAKVTVTTNRIDAEDVKLLLAEKEQVIRKSGMLEFYATPEEFRTVGGLEELKRWLRQRGKAFSQAAREFGLPSPRGLLLVGVPGCGKSLTAKAVAAEWRMPLLKFDLGKVFGAYVGDSEANMRRALKTAEAVAPCILWVDEIEKGLAGAADSSGDSGVTARVLGTLLTWMEENASEVFTIATANAIQALPPELLRKGRFDEVFFIDLPTAYERHAIFRIHLQKRNRDYRDFDMAAHVRATEGFSGAELEQVAIAALYEAFAEGEETPLRDDHLDRAIQETAPLSRSMGELVEALREEARTRWRLASTDGGTATPNDMGAADTTPMGGQPRHLFEV